MNHNNDRSSQAAEHDASHSGESDTASNSEARHLDPDHRGLLELAYRQGNLVKVGQLVASGADTTELGWTDIFHAIVLGDTNDLKKAIDSGCDLEHKDCLGKTPLMLSAIVGDPDKTAMLIEARANANIINHYEERYLLAHTISKDNADMLELLLDNGLHHEQRNLMGNTPLIVAAREGAIKCLKALIARGADVSAESTSPEAKSIISIVSPESTNPDTEIMINRTSNNNDEHIYRTAMKVASNPEIVTALMKAGADINHTKRSMLAEILGYHTLDESAEPEFSRKDLEKYISARYGKTNPELATNSYWQAMIECNWEPWKIAHTYNIDKFKYSPLWTYNRNFSGGSIIPLPGGRYVEIGGTYFEYAASLSSRIYNDVQEHAPGAWKPDQSCTSNWSYNNSVLTHSIRIGEPNKSWTSNWVYNDVIVHDGMGNCDIYIYPREVFPPLYDHTATLVNQHIYIIGNSCAEDKGFLLDNHTQVLRLDIATMKIERIETRGDIPGQAGKYYAFHNDKSKLSIQKMDYVDNTEEYTRRYGIHRRYTRINHKNKHRYTLCLESMQWEKQNTTVLTPTTGKPSMTEVIT